MIDKTTTSTRGVTSAAVQAPTAARRHDDDTLRLAALRSVNTDSSLPFTDVGG